MVKSGTSITMDKDVLKWIDERVKKRVFSSRSHAFEYAVRQLMSMKCSMEDSCDHPCVYYHII